MDVHISTDPADIDLDILHSYLVNAYWCEGIPRDIMERSVNNSVPFSVLLPDDSFIGFARLVTDHSTFAYLCDVIIDERYRGQGMGHLLVKKVNEWMDEHQIRTALLLTRDAQGLYAAHDWMYFPDANRVMRYGERNQNFYQTHFRS